MFSRSTRISLAAAPALLGLAVSAALAGPCTGPGAPATAQTQCLTAVAIPGNPIRSFDISWVNPHRGEYYLAERSNAGIVVIDTRTLTWKRTIGGFVGIQPPTGAVNNNISGPDGVTSHGRWLYAGDGNSTLKVIDLDASSSPIKQSIPTGGSTRVDEMALTTDGEILLAANNAEDPPFSTVFMANGDRSTSNVTIFTRITVDPAIIPPGAGLSMEQPTWEPKTQRFYNSVPQIANNPAGCTFDGSGGHPICQGGMLVIDPNQLTAGSTVLGAYDPVKNVGMVGLSDCGPNGISVGPHSNMMLGCTPQNVATNTTTQVINAKTHNFVEVGGLTGSDEVWYNSGDNRYYTGSSRACGKAAGCNPVAPSRAPAGAALGVVDAKTNFLIEKIPASSNSHSVAADSKRNLIFVPQVAPNTVVLGGDSTDVGAGICGTNNGCVGVYIHRVDNHDHDGDDHDRDDHDHGHDDHDHGHDH